MSYLANKHRYTIYLNFPLQTFEHLSTVETKKCVLVHLYCQNGTTKQCDTTA
jgi:hypothetical protein